jgi:hypothetical protein
MDNLRQKQQLIFNNTQLPIDERVDKICSLFEEITPSDDNNEKYKQFLKLCGRNRYENEINYMYDNLYASLLMIRVSTILTEVANTEFTPNLTDVVNTNLEQIHDIYKQSGLASRRSIVYSHRPFRSSWGEPIRGFAPDVTMSLPLKCKIILETMCKQRGITRWRPMNTKDSQFFVRRINDMVGNINLFSSLLDGITHSTVLDSVSTIPNNNANNFFETLTSGISDKPIKNFIAIGILLFFFKDGMDLQTQNTWITHLNQLKTGDITEAIGTGTETKWNSSCYTDTLPGVTSTLVKDLGIHADYIIDYLNQKNDKSWSSNRESALSTKKTPTQWKTVNDIAKEIIGMKSELSGSVIFKKATNFIERQNECYICGTGFKKSKKEADYKVEIEHVLPFAYAIAYTGIAPSFNDIWISGSDIGTTVRLSQATDNERIKWFTKEGGIVSRYFNEYARSHTCCNQVKKEEPLLTFRNGKPDTGNCKKILRNIYDRNRNAGVGDGWCGGPNNLKLHRGQNTNALGDAWVKERDLVINSNYLKPIIKDLTTNQKMCESVGFSEVILYAQQILRGSEAIHNTYMALTDINSPSYDSNFEADFSKRFYSGKSFNKPLTLTDIINESKNDYIKLNHENLGGIDTSLGDDEIGNNILASITTSIKKRFAGIIYKKVPFTRIDSYWVFTNNGDDALRHNLQIDLSIITNINDAFIKKSVALNTRIYPSNAPRIREHITHVLFNIYQYVIVLDEFINVNGYYEKGRNRSFGYSKQRKNTLNFVAKNIHFNFEKEHQDRLSKLISYDSSVVIIEWSAVIEIINSYIGPEDEDEFFDTNETIPDEWFDALDNNTDVTDVSYADTQLYKDFHQTALQYQDELDRVISEPSPSKRRRT